MFTLLNILSRISMSFATMSGSFVGLRVLEVLKEENRKNTKIIKT